METLTRPMNNISRCTHLYRDAALAGTGLTSPQVPYLLRLCRMPGQTQEELAQGLHVHKSSVTRILANLERDGWITRTPAPPYLLRLCRMPGQTQEELAQGLHVHKSSVTRILANLERDGWITRTPAPQDRRALQVYPTEKTQELLPRLHQILSDWNGYLIQELSPEEADTLLSLLQRVAARAEAWAEDREDS